MNYFLIMWVCKYLCEWFDIWHIANMLNGTSQCIFKTLENCNKGEWQIKISIWLPLHEFYNKKQHIEKARINYLKDKEKAKVIDYWEKCSSAEIL